LDVNFEQIRKSAERIEIDDKARRGDRKSTKIDVEKSFHNGKGDRHETNRGSEEKVEIEKKLKDLQEQINHLVSKKQ